MPDSKKQKGKLSLEFYFFLDLTFGSFLESDIYFLESAFTLFVFFNV